MLQKGHKDFHAAELRIIHKGARSTSHCCEYGLLHITEVLLDRGDDLYQCKTPLLVTAIKRQNLEMMKLLLHQANINPNIQSSWQQRTSLSLCCRARASTQVVEMLLQLDHINVNVNCKDSRGHTPLMTAVDIW